MKSTLRRNRKTLAWRIAGPLVVAVCFAPAAWAQELEPTPDVGAGPNHRPGAPFRAKLSPPLAEGTVLVIRGHVRASDTGEPLSGVVLDAFQSDARGRYDMKGFDYRARVLTDENGYFEFETIHPESYGPPPHIHFIITKDGYRTLATELRFRGDLEERGQDPDAHGTAVELKRRTAGDGFYEEGVLDIVLAPARD